jgi:hypothetical protein
MKEVDQSSITNVLADPKVRDTIMKSIKEIGDCQIRIAGERSFISEEIKALSEKYKIAPKHLRKLAKTYFKNNLNELISEDEEFQILAETLLGDAESTG